MWEMAWVGPALLMSRTPSSIRGGCNPARSTTGHTHTIARAFYEDFSDLALFAASPAALRWALLVLVHQEERPRDQERRAGRARRPQNDICPLVRPCDRARREPAALEAAKLVYRCKELGLILFYSGIYSNVIEVTPPLTLTREQADQGLAIVDQALADVAASRFPDEKLGMYPGW